MTEQEQIRAISELDGKSKLSGTELDYTIPRYLTSRDAIVPVIEKQPVHIKQSVLKWLELWNGEWTFLAKSAELAEALLRATGKWKD